MKTLERPRVAISGGRGSLSARIFLGWSQLCRAWFFFPLIRFFTVSIFSLFVFFFSFLSVCLFVCLFVRLPSPRASRSASIRSRTRGESRLRTLRLVNRPDVSPAACSTCPRRTRHRTRTSSFRLLARTSFARLSRRKSKTKREKTGKHWKPDGSHRASRGILLSATIDTRLRACKRKKISPCAEPIGEKLGSKTTKPKCHCLSVEPGNVHTLARGKFSSRNFEKHTRCPEKRRPSLSLSLSLSLSPVIRLLSLSSVHTSVRRIASLKCDTHGDSFRHRLCARDTCVRVSAIVRQFRQTQPERHTTQRDTTRRDTTRLRSQERGEECGDSPSSTGRHCCLEPTSVAGPYLF